MARCNNDLLISKIGVKALSKTIEVDFAVLTDTENCVRINTRNYLEAQEEVVFNTFLTPPDMFACLADGCKNSGTLMLTGGSEVSAEFQVRTDATEFSAGVMTYYAFFPEAGTYIVTTEIADIRDENLNDADGYEKEVTVTSAGFHPIIVDLCDYPNVKQGWRVSDRGVRVRLSATMDPSSALTVGFSSIFFYNSIEDFQVNDTVKVGCIDEFSGEFTLDARDASCFGVGYDPASISIERTITGRSVTANYWKLNPLTKKGEGRIGWLPRTVELKVEASDIEGYGTAHLVDINPDECGFLLASVAHDCRVTEGMLNRVNTPTPVKLENNQFIMLDHTVVGQEAGVLLFNEALIDSIVVISYPQQVEAEHFVGNADDLDARRVRMSIVKEQTDGVRQHYVYNNVLVTRFLIHYQMKKQHLTSRFQSNVIVTETSMICSV